MSIKSTAEKVYKKYFIDGRRYTSIEDETKKLINKAVIDTVNNSEEIEQKIVNAVTQRVMIELVNCIDSYSWEGELQKEESIFSKELKAMLHGEAFIDKLVERIKAKQL